MMLRCHGCMDRMETSVPGVGRGGFRLGDFACFGIQYNKYMQSDQMDNVKETFKDITNSYREIGHNGL
ncbi:hypothetical protein PVK06_028858 [Gossypium arboreum]|uniref:Uncharacterized protein n=1 Tax=Gossypium arboreum TaxID=29729 RepID=A0ABR0P528_GOSAR|nr:hypothetical protein PVK06_028858 [Gossypium arboreum]